MTDGGSNWQPPETGGGTPPPPPPGGGGVRASPTADTAPEPVSGPDAERHRSRRRRARRPVDGQGRSPRRSARWRSSAPASSPSPASPVTTRRPAAPTRPRRRPTLLLDAIDNEDVLGARRRPAARRARDVPRADAATSCRELKRLEVLSDDRPVGRRRRRHHGHRSRGAGRARPTSTTSSTSTVTASGRRSRSTARSCRSATGSASSIGEDELAELDERPTRRSESVPGHRRGAGRALVPQPLLHASPSRPAHDAATPTSRPSGIAPTGGDSPEAAMDNVCSAPPPSSTSTAMIGVPQPERVRGAAALRPAVPRRRPGRARRHAEADVSIERHRRRVRR